MKVLYISHTSEMHGSGKALLNILEEMISKGVDVCIVIPKADGALYKILRAKKIEYYCLHVALWIWPRSKTLRDYILFPYRFLILLARSVLFYKELYHVAVRKRPNIIHSNIGVMHIGHYVSKKLHISHVWHIREYQDLDFGWKPFPSKTNFQELLLNKNNYPIAITKGIFKHYNLHLDSNAKVIYDGVFDTAIVPQIKIQKKKYFLFVGLVSEGKGTQEAIKAFISISPKYPEYELWIAGGGAASYIDNLKKIVAESHCDKKVKFLGQRPDVYMLMSDAMALIVASKFEGFGFITAEAMFNGCLVIGKNNAGTKEQFDNVLCLMDEEVGIRYNSLDELKNVIQQLCETGIDSYLDKLKKAQNAVTEIYASKKNAEEIYNLYKNILNKKYDK